MKFSMKLMLGLLCAQAAFVTAADESLDVADFLDNHDWAPDFQPAAANEVEPRAADEEERLYNALENIDRSLPVALQLYRLLGEFQDIDQSALFQESRNGQAAVQEIVDENALGNAPLEEALLAFFEATQAGGSNTYFNEDAGIERDIPFENKVEFFRGELLNNMKNTNPEVFKALFERGLIGEALLAELNRISAGGEAGNAAYAEIEQAIARGVAAMEARSFEPYAVAWGTLDMLNRPGYLEHIYKQAAKGKFSPAVEKMSLWLAGALDELESVALTDVQKEVIANAKIFFEELGSMFSAEAARSLWEEFELNKQLKLLFSTVKSLTASTSAPAIPKPATAPIASSGVLNEKVLADVLARVLRDQAARQTLKSGGAVGGVTLSNLGSDKTSNAIRAILNQTPAAASTSAVRPVIRRPAAAVRPALVPRSVPVAPIARPAAAPAGVPSEKVLAGVLARVVRDQAARQTLKSGGAVGGVTLSNLGNDKTSNAIRGLVK